MEGNRRGGIIKALTLTRRRLISAFGYLLSIVCMVYVIRRTDWEHELPHILNTPWQYVAAAFLSDIAVYCVQGWRWNELLTPVGKLPVWRTMQAIYVGLFVNEVVPGKPGEIVRSFLQARWSGIPFSIVISSVIIERLFDGIWLICGFFVTSLFVKLPPIFVIASRILGVFLIVVAGLLALAILRRAQTDRWLQRTIWAQGLRHLLDALETMGRSPSFYRAMFLSLLYLILQVGPIYFIQRGYGLDLSLGACAAILVILRIGSIPPQAPGNFGTFQLLASLGAVSFGVDPGRAGGFANLLFFAITGPLWLTGFFALLATKMKLSQLMQEVEK